MLSVPFNKCPRRIYIRVAKAEKLVSSRKQNNKKNNSKFRVVIHGGKKKESSLLVNNINGNPDWNFSCIIKLNRGKSDPVCLLVEDSEGHHKGQVVIPLVKIGPKPYTYNSEQCPATSSNLICSELEPTNKCSLASGFLIYWIWVEEYYAEEVDESRNPIKNSISLIFGSSKSGKSATSGSISNISSSTSLSKSESHKNTLGFLHIKSKKNKSKNSFSEYRMTPDSSDVELHVDFRNPFEYGNKNGKFDHESKNSSLRSADLELGRYNNPFYIPTDRIESEKFDVLSHGSHGCVSEVYSEKDFEPTVMPNTIKQTLLNKLNHGHILNPSLNQEVMKTGSLHSEIDHRFQPSHNFFNKIDYSNLNDRILNPPPSIAIKILNDETEALRKENLELKMKNNKSLHIISDLQSELNSVKDSLFKLRLKLLEEGETKFLEKV